jgi:hypothetical protein
VNGISASMVGLGIVNNTTDLLKPVSTATQTALNLKLNSSDTLGLRNSIFTKLAKTDTLGLSNRINTKLAKTDTLGLSNRINSKLAKTDTASLSNRINTKLAKADTLGLSNRINTKAPINNPTFTGIVNGISASMVGLGNVNNTTDLLKPVSTATQTALNLKLNSSDTLGLRNSIFAKLAKADTLGLSNRINTKLAKADTAGLSNRINTKLAKTDTVGLSIRINTKLAKTDTAGLSNRINLKLAIADTLALSNRINSKLAKSDTTSLSIRINSKLAKADTTSLRNGINARATIASPTFTGTPLAPTATAGTSSTQIATTAFVQDAFTSFATSNGSSGSILAGAIWTSSTTGTLNGIGFTMTQLRDANPSNWDMSTSDFSAAPLSATQNSGTISHGDDWVVTFASPISDLKLYCKYWRPASYVFSQPLTLLSSGNGLTSPNSNTVTVGANAWGNGIIQFAGPITTLSVNSSASLINDASGQILTFGVGSVGPASGTGEIIRSANPTFTGTVSGITKAMVGLGNVDNTSDLDKPISTATQAALDDKVTKSNTRVAIGYYAGDINQQDYSVAIGSNASKDGQGTQSVAIGFASNSYGNKATAIGGFALAHYLNSTAIGYQAETNTDNTIQLGADGTNGSTAITNVKTSGTLTAGTITYPNTAGSANQVLTTDGNGVASWATGIIGVTQLAGDSSTALATTEFVTAAVSSLNNVDLTNNQTIAGAKIFSADLRVNSLTVGKGAGSIATNTAIGNNTLYNNSTGFANTANGSNALLLNTIGSGNTAIGINALSSNSSGTYNTAIGAYTMLFNETGIGNTALGYGANYSSPMVGVLTNATAIGYRAGVSASNSIQLGNTSVTVVKTSGALTTGTITYPNTAGSANQVLITDGSGVASWSTPNDTMVGLENVDNTSDVNKPISTATQTALDLRFTNEVSDEETAIAGQTSFILSHAPSANSKVKMYINGIRISNTAYTFSSTNGITTLTYDPNFNGANTLIIGDRIQFDFSY